MKLTLLLFTYLFPLVLNAQTTNLRAAYALDRLSDSGGLSVNETVYGIPRKPGEVVGNSFYFDEYRLSSIMIYDVDKQIINVPARLDIKDNFIEMNYSFGLRIIDGSRVKSFKTQNQNGSYSYFINSKNFKHNGVQLLGFLEILSEGEVYLFKKKEVIMVKGHYVPALNAGTPDTEIKKIERFFILVDSKLIEVPSKNSEFVSLFPAKNDEIFAFIKSNKLRLKREMDLKFLIDYINR